MVEIRWLGTAGLEIAFDGTTLLVDPYLTRAGKLDLLFRRLRPSTDRLRAYVRGLGGRVSAIVCGHTHFDHALDVPFLARERGCPLVGSSSLKTLAGLSGISPDMRVCRGGEEVELPGGASVRMIPSRHGRVLFGRVPCPGEIDPCAELPFKVGQYRLGAMFMPRIEAGGVSIAHQGSAGCLPEELEGLRCDVLFMCVPGWKKTPGYPEACIELLRPGVVVPFHFDDFTTELPESGPVRRLPGSDLEGFIARVSRHAPGIEVRVPDPRVVMRF